MIRMLSGLAAPVIGGLTGLFKRNGEVSAYRIVLAVTVAAVGWGLWAGWAQWILFGEGVAEGGFGAALGTFAARWAAGSWLAIVLLYPLDDDIAIPAVGIMLMICAAGTLGQVMYTHGAFARPERTHYRATVSCEHCGASCYVHVKIGESWTDWESVECCRCGIEVSPERMPEYAESREAWDARAAPDGGGDGAED